MNRYPTVTAHQLIADVCVEMANEIYEELCSGSNAVYKIHGDRDDFLRQCAPTLKKAAIAQLSAMLGDPKVSDAEKETIYEAIMMDRVLPKSGTSMVHKSML